MPETLGRPATRATYVPQLDGLRFVAIAIVIVWHASLRATRHIHAIDGTSGIYRWLPHGELGVALFFFLSGFVIAEPAFMSGARRMDVTGFWWRRFRRIWPPYLVALTGCLALILASGFTKADLGPSVKGSYAASLFYLNGLVFSAPSPLDPPLWSLEVEAQFYLVAPFILMAYAMWKGPTRHWVGAGAVVFVVLAMGLVGPGHEVDGRFRLGLLTHLDLFLGGIVASGLMAHRLPVGPERRSAWGDWLFAAGLAGMYALGLFLTAVDAKPPGGLPLIGVTAVTLALTVAVFMGALHGRVAGAVLSNGWIRLFGTMCFSIYLVHVPVIQAVDTLVMRHVPMHGVVVTYIAYVAMGFAASLPVGLAFYVLVERRFMNRRPGAGAGASKAPAVRDREAIDVPSGFPRSSHA